MKEVNIISKVVGRSGAEASPSSVAITPNMSGYATKTELNTLRNEFNDFLEGDDADVVINKWQDLVLFLEGISEDFDLLSMLGLKADKSELSNYVTIATKQTITSEKNFTGGLKVNGSPIVYDATNKYWKLEGDLLVTGGVTMYTSDSAFTPSTIMDAIATDNVNLKVVNGVLTFVGQTGGGVADSVLWDNVVGKPSWIGSSKPSYSYSEISGTPTLLSSFHNDVEFVSKGTTLSHYGITNAIGYLNAIIADKADAYNLAGYGTTGGGFPINGGAIKVGINNYQMILHGRHDTLRFNTVEAGTLKTWRKVWHDGNFNPSDYLLASNYTASDILAKLLTVDGEGSGLDADLLDGLEAGDIQRRSLSFYRAHNATSVNKTDLNNVLEGMVYNYSSFAGWVNAPKDMTYGQVLAIRNHLNDELVGQIAWDVNHNSKTDATKNLYFRASDINGFAYSQWHTIAFIDSNVASATKLQTARTIWGQSFDGTADVSGDLFLGQNGSIHITARTNGWESGFVAKNTSNTSKLGMFGLYGMGNTLKYAFIGKSYSDNWVRFLPSGNVLIGTTTDSGYKLDVNGSTQVRDQFRLLSTNGVYEGIIQLYSSGELALHSTKIGVDYTNLIINRNGGNVGIGTASPTYKLDVNGTIHAYSNVRSDANIYANNHLFASGHVFLGNGEEGVYVTKNGVAWHDSSNSYVTSLLQFDFDGSVNIPNKLKVSNIPIYKSQDDVLYIDGNLAVRGGITMYATDAIDVPSIIDALPIASASAKGIAAFNPNDFSVVDGYVSFIGKGGVDESVLADYAKKTDLSKYLPLSGGQMTGGIDYPLGYMGNLRDLASSCVFDYTDSLTAKGVIDNKRSLMGYAHNVTNDRWMNIISVRGDSNTYGMYICSDMTEYGGNLHWNKQEGYDGTWQGERVILDSVNWSDYVSVGSGNISGNKLTIDGEGYRGAYPALRLHIPNVTYVQFLMTESGMVELRYGDSGQSGGLQNLSIYTLYTENGLHFGGGEDFDYHGNIYIPNADGSWSWNVFNSNNSNVMSVYTNGNVLVAGGITMYSDIRKKTKLQDVELTLQQIADAPLIEHYYNSDAMRTTHVGSIAQYWAGMNDWFCKLDNDGYYTMEIQNAALASAISIARELVKYESKTDRKIRLLKERVKELEDKIEKLENN